MSGCFFLKYGIFIPILIVCSSCRHQQAC